VIFDDFIRLGRRIVRCSESHGLVEGEHRRFGPVQDASSFKGDSKLLVVLSGAEPLVAWLISRSPDLAFIIS
jgi:hypothetical protein